MSLSLKPASTIEISFQESEEEADDYFCFNFRAISKELLEPGMFYALSIHSKEPEASDVCASRLFFFFLSVFFCFFCFWRQSLSV